MDRRFPQFFYRVRVWPLIDVRNFVPLNSSKMNGQKLKKKLFTQIFCFHSIALS